MSEPSTLFLKIQYLEERVEALSEAVDELEQKIMIKLENLTKQLNHLNEHKTRIEFMVNTMWKKPKRSDKDIFTNGLNNIISTVAIWVSGITISTILITLLQNWLKK